MLASGCQDASIVNKLKIGMLVLGRWHEVAGMVTSMDEDEGRQCGGEKVEVGFWFGYFSLRRQGQVCTVRGRDSAMTGPGSKAPASPPVSHW